MNRGSGYADADALSAAGRASRSALARRRAPRGMLRAALALLGVTSLLAWLVPAAGATTLPTESAPQSGGLLENAPGGVGETAPGGLGETTPGPVVDPHAGLAESLPGVLRSPAGLAISPQGDIWVADAGADNVVELSPSGAFIQQFGEPGSGPGQLDWPRGVALGPEGNVWVLDTGNNRIEEFSSAGKYLGQLGSAGTSEGQFLSPGGIAIDPQGDIWVAEGVNGRVQEFTPSEGGGFGMHEFQERNTDPAGEPLPQAIAIGPEGDVWVSDPNADSVQQYTPTGQLLREIGTGPAFGLAIDSEGDAWVAEPFAGEIREYSPDGSTKAAYRIDGSSPGTIEGSLPGQSSLPDAIAIASNGDLIVAEAGGRRVQELSSGSTGGGDSAISPAPAGPVAPSGGWSVVYGDAFNAPIGTASGDDNTWYPNNCEPISANCEGFNSNEMEDFSASQVSVDSEGLKLKCTYESTAQLPGDKHYLCGVAKGADEPPSGYRPFKWAETNQGQTLVFQVVAKLPPTTDEADPGWWSDGFPYEGTEFDFFEAGGWGSDYSSGWKTSALYTAWFAPPHPEAVMRGFPFEPNESFHTYTTEIFPNDTYSEYIDGKLQPWATDVGPASPDTSADLHLILSYALRECGECHTGFTSGSRTFDIRSVAVYEDTPHAGDGITDGGLAPGTSIE